MYGVLVNDGDFMEEGALQGIGIAYLLEEVVLPHLKAARLTRVLEPYCTPFPGLSLYYPSRAQIAPKLQALVDFLRYPARRKR